MKIVVVIPCYRVRLKINGVLESIPNSVDTVYLVDDACPDASLSVVNPSGFPFRICIINNPMNLGVGGAVKRGYCAALKDGADVIVKMDGDGQMDGKNLSEIISPIIRRHADYVKGNRFLRYDALSEMPFIRIFGNAGLSFITKISSGYWDIADPTNGFTAIHRIALSELPLEKIDNRYFFESDMLFRLGTVSAVVFDAPLEAKYGDETSNLSVSRALPEFAAKNFKNSLKRIIFGYYVRELNLASFELAIGLSLLIFGVLYGSFNWLVSFNAHVESSTGVIMITMTSIIVGVQMLLSFVNFDVSRVPRLPLQVKYGQTSPD